MQLIPWGSIREVAERVFIKADRAVRRGGGAAAVGGIARAENQASGDRGDRDGALAKKRAPGQDDDARVECDKDPAENSVQEQLAMFTLLKIVSKTAVVVVGVCSSHLTVLSMYPSTFSTPSQCPDRFFTVHEEDTEAKTTPFR